MRVMSLKVRRCVKLGALLAIGAASPGAAQIIWSTGCVAWSSVNGCTSMQTCWANASTGAYACTVTTAGGVS